MRVVHVDGGNGWRGGQLQVFLLHRGLLDLGVDSMVLTPEGSPLMERCRAHRLPAEALPGRMPWHALAHGMRRWWRRSDIVHSHDAHSATVAAVASRLGGGLRWVCHRRVSYAMGGGIAGRLKYRCVDRWIAVSGAVRRRLLMAGVGEERCRVVPSAVEVERLRSEAAAAELPRLRRQLGLGDRQAVVGVVGALTEDKGQRVLLEAMPGLLRTHPDASILVVGDGPQRQRLEGLSRRLGIASRAVFLGFRDDVAALTALFTVAVVPSLDGEGSPAVVKEAMVLGRPLVVSDLDSCRETADGAGVLVPPGDPVALAAAIGELLQRPDRRAELAARGYAAAKRFRADEMAAATAELYRELVRTGR